MNVRWNRAASRQLHKQLRYIAEESITASEAVRRRLDRKVRRICTNPLSSAPDRMKRSNDSTFRAFTSDRLRVSYRVFKDSIHIIRVRHTSRKPLRY